MNTTEKHNQGWLETCCTSAGKKIKHTPTLEEMPVQATCMFKNSTFLQPVQRKHTEKILKVKILGFNNYFYLRYLEYYKYLVRKSVRLEFFWVQVEEMHPWRFFLMEVVMTMLMNSSKEDDQRVFLQDLLQLEQPSPGQMGRPRQLLICIILRLSLAVPFAQDSLHISPLWKMEREEQGK